MFIVFSGNELCGRMLLHSEQHW